MSARVTLLSGGPYDIFGQTLTSGYVDVSIFQLNLGLFGVMRDAARQYRELRALITAGGVSVAIADVVFVSTTGFDAAVKEAGDISTLSGVVDPDPDTVPMRNGAGELLATKFLGPDDAAAKLESQTGQAVEIIGATNLELTGASGYAVLQGLTSVGVTSDGNVNVESFTGSVSVYGDVNVSSTASTGANTVYGRTVQFSVGDEEDEFRFMIGNTIALKAFPSVSNFTFETARGLNFLVNDNANMTFTTGRDFVVDAQRYIDLEALTVIYLRAGADYGVDIDTGGSVATETPASGQMRISTNGLELAVLDSTGRSDTMNRTRPHLTSSGSVALGFDTHHVLSGTVTPSALPPAQLEDIGRCIAITNRTGGTLTISRSGSDTIDGSTSFVIVAGAKAVFECVAVGDWAVWG